ncbi:MAG: hypothetical protein ACRDHZ_00205 [Ktedonobacteraceae bacterium]
MSENQVIERPAGDVVEAEATEVREVERTNAAQLAGAMMEPSIQRRSASLEVAIAEAKAKAIADRFTAREYKRDLAEATKDILVACGDPDFASRALSRREESHELDASIRLLEHCAVNYGNLAYGVRMFVRTEEQSEVEVYAIDKQKGSDFSDSFLVRHEMQVGQKVEKVWKPAKVSDLVNSEISKRLRKGLKKMIDPVIMRKAVDMCKATLRKQLEDIEAGKSRLLDKYTENLGVDKFQLQQYLGKPWDKVDRKDCERLFAMYNAIAEGEVKLADKFPKAKKAGAENVAPMAPPQEDKECPASQDQSPANQAKPTKSKSAPAPGGAAKAAQSSPEPSANTARSSAQDAETDSSPQKTPPSQPSKPQPPNQPIKKINF